MQRLQFYSSFLFLFLSMEVSSQEQPERATYPVIKSNEVKNFPIKAGIYDQAFKQSDNSDWNISISIPHIDVGEKAPLILALHWYGEANTYREYSNCLAYPALDTLKAIIIAPSSGGSIWIHPANEKRVINLIQKIVKHWPVWKDQVIITGYSIGAVASWDFAKKYKNLFCASIPVAGQYHASKIQAPLYVIHGAQDELFAVEKVRQSVDESIKKGSKIDFQTIEGFSHFMACGYGMALQKAAIKVKTEILDKQQ